MNNELNSKVKITRAFDKHEYFGLIEESEDDYIVLLGWVDELDEAYFHIINEDKNYLVKKHTSSKDQISLIEDYSSLLRGYCMIMTIPRVTIENIVYL